MNTDLKKSITLKSKNKSLKSKNKLSTSDTDMDTDINTDSSTMSEQEFLQLLRSSDFTQIENWYQAEKRGTNFNITDKQLNGFSSFSKYPQYIRN